MTSAAADFARAQAAYRAGKLEEAQTLCESRLAEQPGQAPYLHLRGMIAYKKKQIGEAESWIGQAVAAHPESADYNFSLALMKLAQKKYDAAAQALEHVLALRADDAKACYYLGTAQGSLGNAAAAASAYLRAIEIKPDYAEAMNNLGILLASQGKRGEAADYYRRAIEIKPDYLEALNNYALVLGASGDLAGAELYYNKALALQPDRPEVLNNLGIIYQLQEDFAKAQDHYRRALELRPAYHEAFNNLGNTLLICGNLEDAVSAYRTALRLDPQNGDAHHNLGVALLTRGEFDEGWQEYEWRWQMQHLTTAKRHFTEPLWRGEAAEGRRLLIHAEQGFGDSLQFCRYVPLAVERGFRVILEVQPALVRLMQSLACDALVMGRGDPLPPFDLHCPMLSLPPAFGANATNIPASPHYLGVEEREAKAWRTRLPQNGKIRVGLVWAGSSRKDQSPELVAVDRRRSLAVEKLRPLLECAGVEFYSLQKNGPQAPASFGLLDFIPECGDFADTAALIVNLDLVISVDTAVAHLAGALGKPVWLLNRFDSCWRWLQTREDSPWYPSMRIFRQRQLGDWDEVIGRVREALAGPR